MESIIEGHEGVEVLQVAEALDILQVVVHGMIGVEIQELAVQLLAGEQVRES